MGNARLREALRWKGHPEVGDSRGIFVPQLAKSISGGFEVFGIGKDLGLSQLAGSRLYFHAEVSEGLCQGFEQSHSLLGFPCNAVQHRIELEGVRRGPISL